VRQEWCTYGSGARCICQGYLPGSLILHQLRFEPGPPSACTGLPAEPSPAPVHAQQPSMVITFGAVLLGPYGEVFLVLRAARHTLGRFAAGMGDSRPPLTQGGAIYRRSRQPSRCLRWRVVAPSPAGTLRGPARPHTKTGRAVGDRRKPIGRCCTAAAARGGVGTTRCGSRSADVLWALPCLRHRTNLVKSWPGGGQGSAVPQKPCLHRASGSPGLLPGR